MTEEQMTTKQAAEFLGCSQRLVQKLCQNGILKSHKVGADLRVSRNELIRYKGTTDPQSFEAILSASSRTGVSVSEWATILSAFRLYREVHSCGWTGDAPDVHLWYQKLVDIGTRLERGEDVDSDPLFSGLPEEIKKVIDSAK